MKTVVLVLLALLCIQQSVALTIDGYMDPYYTLTATVQHQDGAPVANFASPVNYTGGAGFNFYQYADNDYVYGFFISFGQVSNPFASVYYNLRPTTQSAGSLKSTLFLLYFFTTFNEDLLLNLIFLFLLNTKSLLFYD